MARGLFVINKPISRSLIQQPPPPLFLNQTPSPPSSDGFDLNDKVTPSILLIIIVLAIIFFVSGVLHLLVRYLLRPLPNRGDHHDDSESVTALQGQLQQLFQLHDSGVDQSYIDTLPVFSYKAIIGVKDPFDCAVCLCEFEPEDRLRLLPKCSHAFHMDCIDTWLLSHSTCPICRGSLISDIDFSSANQNCSPIVFVLESGSHESYSDIDFPDSEPSTNLDLVPLSELLSQSCEIERKGVEDQPSDQPSAEKVVAVKLGKYKNVDCVGEGSTSSTSNGNIDSRRCFSMGSFAYVMEENTNLHVPIRTPMKKQVSKKPTLPLNPGLKLAMSECGGDSRRFSFRFPFQQNVVAADDRKIKNGGGAARRTASEISLGQLETGGSEWGSVEEEIHSSNSLDSQQSFTRRTLRWLMGRQNKVVHSTFSSNV